MSLERIKDSYDILGAVTALEEYTTMRMKSKTSYLQLASFCQEFPPMYTVIKPEGESRGARLGIYADEGESVHEAVLRYQGILFSHDLPPVTKKTKIDDKVRRFLSQSICVTGFGCDSFQQAHNGGMVVAEQLGSHLADDSLPSWKAKSFHEHDGMQASNRYYSYKKNNNKSPVVAFAHNVDPFQTLSEMAGDDFEHTQDNEVDYLVCLQTEGQKLSYRPKDPATFLAGDIVEIQVSFAVFKTREGKKTLNPVLRGVTLLNGKFSKAARIEQMKIESKKKNVQTPVLKRKSGYDFDEEEVDYAQKSFKKMSISPS